jgi:hypothetical protein
MTKELPNTAAIATEGLVFCATDTFPDALFIVIVAL